MKKAVFLDRDGTVIVDKIYLNDPNGIEYFPRVFDALSILTKAGFELVIVTNQSGVAKGIVTIENLDQIHKNMATDGAKYGIKYAGFYYAPYSVESNHHMRKPNPGMLEAGAKDLGIDLKSSWMVGDRMTDVEAGRRAGTRTVLLAGVETPEGSSFDGPDAFVSDLFEAAKFIVSK